MEEISTKEIKNLVKLAVKDELAAANKAIAEEKAKSGGWINVAEKVVPIFEKIVSAVLEERAKAGQVIMVPQNTDRFTKSWKGAYVENAAQTNANAAALQASQEMGGAMMPQQVAAIQYSPEQVAQMQANALKQQEVKPDLENVVKKLEKVLAWVNMQSTDEIKSRIKKNEAAFAANQMGLVNALLTSDDKLFLKQFDAEKAKEQLQGALKHEVLKTQKGWNWLLCQLEILKANI